MCLFTPEQVENFQENNTVQKYLRDQVEELNAKIAEKEKLNTELINMMSKTDLAQNNQQDLTNKNHQLEATIQNLELERVHQMEEQKKSVQQIKENQRKIIKADEEI